VIWRASLAIAFTLAAAVSGAGTPDIAFDQHIRPILEANCVECHGPSSQKSGLRLDAKAAALQGGDSGPIAIPGDSANSEIIRRVSGVDPADRMPPKGDPLSEDQVNLLTAWIDQGMEWPDDGKALEITSDHWAFQKPVEPDIPEVDNDAWVKTPIDAFVLARLEQEGYDPSPEADRVTLIRRLHFDLIGIPPTPQEVDAFINDESPYAYEALVNRLLASPHFGERWGRHWLDLARYADSNGYEKDNVRPYAYRYRDWVIDALNRDLPYDQFVIQQLAGDLLPNPTQDELLATGFHRNTLTNTEGGIDPEEDRVKQAKDRTNTTASVFLGLTMACAECHTHKYDPLTQREYYKMYGFFNEAMEKNVPAPDPAERVAYEQALAKFREEMGQVERDIREYRPELEKSLSEWEQSLDLPKEGWTPLDAQSLESANGADLKKLDDRSVLVGGESPEKDEYTVTMTTDKSRIKAIRLEALTHPDLTANGPGRAHNGNFVLAEFKAYAAPARDPENKTEVKFASAWADFEQEGLEVAKSIDGDTNTGWAIYRKEDMNRDRMAIYTPEQPLGFEGGAILTFVLDHHYGREHNIGRFRISVTPEDPAEIRFPDNVLQALQIPHEDRTDAQKNAVLDYYGKTDPRMRELLAARRSLQEAKPDPPKTQAQAMAANPEPPDTRIHIRGNFLEQGDEVNLGVPAVLNNFHARNGKPDRLDLARWIVDNDNPLTARVQTNRIWKYLFGQGIVTTPEDFGTRSDPPSHPDLLDWLAIEYQRMGWSTKEMIRLIVNSNTYKQSSHVRPELWDRDPQNRLLARQNRYRVSAEIVRDSYLAVSGLLDRTVGGPSVRPPLPEGVTNLGYANSIKWPESQGSDKYRRGIYIFFQRTVPYPMLMTFDCPDSNVSEAKRTRSNTPLQALTLLNDVVFFEAAQALGGRLIAETFEDDAALAERAFRICMGRHPTDEEVDALAAFVNEQRAMFAENTEAAIKFANRHQPEGADPVEAATRVALARVILNVDEFVTRE